MTVGRIPVIEGGIQPTIFDAKADLLTATANDTPARLAVGANGTTLVADSTASTGLAWAKSPNFTGAVLFESGAGTQSIPTSTLTAVTFDSETIDTDAFHSTSTNTSRITIPTGLGGKYRFTLGMLWDQNGTGNRYLQLFKNGAGFRYGADLAPTAGLYIGYNYSWIVSAVAGDYFELFVNQTSGGNLVLYKRETESLFQCQYLGA
jgi:hypothetical protein